MAKRKNKGQGVKRFFAYLLSFISLVLSVLLIYQLFKFQLIPTDALLIGCGILLLIVALCFGLSKAKKVKSIVFFINIMLIAVLSYANYNYYLTRDMLKGNTNHTNYEDKFINNDEYISIITLADAKIETVNELIDKNVGLDTSFEPEKMIFAGEWLVSSYSSEINLTNYDNLLSLVDSLLDGSLDAIVMDSSRYALCDNIYETFLDDTKEVAKLTINYYKYYAQTSPTPTPSPTPIPEESEPDNREITEKPFILYISGIDTTGVIETKSRSDTNILMAVNPKTKKILLVSTPRDTYTPLANISGETKDKLTHAGLYGVNCSMDTLEALYDTSIDYYIRVNFTSVVNIVDALGGIDVYSAYTFNSANILGYHFNEGMNHLDGKATLVFCRERYSFPDGDYQRGRDHIETIKGVINKATDPSILMNYSSLIEALSGSYETNMDPEDMASLVRMQLSDSAEWEFDSMTLVNTGAFSTTCYSLYGPSLYVGIIDETSRQEIEDTLKAFMNEE